MGVKYFPRPPAPKVHVHVRQFLLELSPSRKAERVEIRSSQAVLATCLDPRCVAFSSLPVWRVADYDHDRQILLDAVCAGTGTDDLVVDAAEAQFLNFGIV